MAKAEAQKKRQQEIAAEQLRSTEYIRKANRESVREQEKRRAAEVQVEIAQAIADKPLPGTIGDTRTVVHEPPIKSHVKRNIVQRGYSTLPLDPIDPDEPLEKIHPTERHAVSKTAEEIRQFASKQQG